MVSGAAAHLPGSQPRRPPLPIWHLAGVTGLPRREVLGLRWGEGEVALEHGVVAVRRFLGYADTALGQPKALVFGPVKNH